MRKEDRYLQKRGGRWHYVRRVPTACQAIDDRGFVRVTLNTGSLEMARERRNALEAADNQLWGLLESVSEEPEDSARRARQLAERRYQAARSRAMSQGLVYAPAGELSTLFAVDDILDRISTLQRIDTGDARPAMRAEAEAILGGVERPSVSVTEAFEVYCDEIAIGDLLNKSPGQRKLWRKTKLRAINYFVEVVGNKPMETLTREDALKFYNWWADRLKPKKGAQARGANTANRDLGNLRLLYREYFTPEPVPQSRLQGNHSRQGAALPG